MNSSGQQIRQVLRSHRLILAAGAILLALALVAALIIVQQRRDRADGLAGRAVATASSTALGSSARNAVASGSAAEPGAEWRSASETEGAWLELSWLEPHEVSRLTLVREVLDNPGVTAGYLEFGDGSYLQLKLSSTSRTTELTFEPRVVDRLRFTVSEVSQDARAAAISEVLVDNPTAARKGTAGEGHGGNLATDGAVTVDTAGAEADGGPLKDGGPSGDLGQLFRLDEASGASVDLTWDRARELTSVELFGAQGGGSQLSSGTILFDDGGRLPLGAVLPDPTRPTIVSFMPRVTRSLRLTFDEVEGSSQLALSEWRVYGRHGTPWVPERPEGVSPPVEETDCGPVDSTSLGSDLVVQCPTAGAGADDPVTLRTRTRSGYTRVSAMAVPADAALAVGPTVESTPDAAGVSELVLPTAGVGTGPFFVEVTASGARQSTRTVVLQLRGPDTAALPTDSSAAARGRTLAYAEEFDRPLTLSRTGLDADYAAAKPTWYGADDFGDAIFPDPAVGPQTVEVVADRYLRIRVEPTPPGTTDPQGWNRKHFGGLLASARQGGSGFSAQYGYFEARMLAPAMAGTWPAFWTLPSPNLIRSEPVEAEFDAVELYGHDPEQTCHATHSHEGGEDGGETQCDDRFSAREALAWHTYGVAVTPELVKFYVDGVLVGTAPQVKGGDAPMFFMVNLALGGGWPIELAGVQDRAELYVDYVRVYV